MEDEMSKDREKSILEILAKEKKATVADLASRLYISEPSIRRDLASLEKQKMIKRVHGGAILDDSAMSQIKLPFLVREYEESNAKTQMAKEAIELVNDGDVIFLDASTSAYNMIPLLRDKRDIIVITNGVKALQMLAQMDIPTVSTGGELVASCMALVGDDACETVKRYKADVFFFSCRGMSEDGYLTDIAPKENGVRKRMMENSKRSYLLCGKNKIGKEYYHVLCHKNDIDGVISK